VTITFNSGFRATLDRAHAASRRLHHEYIGTEHLLLGLLDAGDARCAALIDALAVDANALEAAIESVVKPGRASFDISGDIPFTSRARKALDLALDAAREAGATDAGPEHLMIGLCDEAKGIAAQVLLDQGVDKTRARAAARQLDTQ
jgi:ATP-dependent Clp protease ATP-binding subunit ClpC